MKDKMKHKKKCRDEFHKCDHDKGRPISYYVWMIIYAPMNLVLFLTALSPNKEEYSKRKAIVWCLLGPMYIINGLFQSFFKTFPMWFYVAIPISIALIIIFCIYFDDKFPEKWGTVFSIVALIVGLLITKTLVAVLIDLLNSVGIVFNLSKTY